MTNRLEAPEDWVAGLLGQLEPESRIRLTRIVGQSLRRSQQQRIIAQQNPHGSKYAPRKRRNLRGKMARVKRKVKMFQKLRTPRFLKAHIKMNAINIGFTGRIARIARVHQHGLRDSAEVGTPNVEYKQRELLGFTDADLESIRDSLLQHLSIF